jgi:hypothetical protein
MEIGHGDPFDAAAAARVFNATTKPGSQGFLGVPIRSTATPCDGRP